LILTTTKRPFTTLVTLTYEPSGKVFGGGGHVILVKYFAVGGSAAVETRTVP
jgi:hypothetical protein